MTHSFIFEFIKYSKTVINNPYKPMNAKNQPNKKRYVRKRTFMKTQEVQIVKSVFSTQQCWYQRLLAQDHRTRVREV